MIIRGRLSYHKSIWFTVLFILSLILAVDGRAQGDLSGWHVLFGVYAGAPSSKNLPGIARFEGDAGKSVSIIHMFQSWEGPPVGLDSPGPEFQPGALSLIRKHGSIPLVTWKPWQSRGGGSAQNANQPAFALRRIIDGDYDAYIARYAKAAKAWGHPFFLRFAQEMNGNWFPWSEQVNGNRKGEYVLAWRHVHDIFIMYGATNVTWVWTPSQTIGKFSELRAYYPGDAYVDWVGADGFNGYANQTWKTFSQVFSPIYTLITAFAPGKPFMIAETACVEDGGDKASWISDALSIEVPRFFPQVKAVVWLNWKYGGPRPLDWRIESSPQAAEAFASGHRRVHLYLQQLWISRCLANSSTVRPRIQLRGQRAKGIRADVLGLLVPVDLDLGSTQGDGRRDLAGYVL